MPVVMERNLGPGDNVLNGVATLSPLKGAQPPVFGPCLLWPNGWMDETPLSTEVYLGPDHIVLQGTQLSPRPRKRSTAASLFRPMFIVATVAHFSYC